MPRYKPVSYEQNIMVPISLEAQIVPGTLEFAIHHLMESKVDISMLSEIAGREKSKYQGMLYLKINRR